MHEQVRKCFFVFFNWRGKGGSIVSFGQQVALLRKAFSVVGEEQEATRGPDFNSTHCAGKNNSQCVIII